MKKIDGRPNFFIVGAPKCGTTSMYAYLSGHPEIYFPRFKEPHHFASDIYSPLYVRDRQRYLDLYTGWQGEPVVGDASVWYLYSRRAAAEIHDFCSDARILVMLRNPVEMVYSYHSQRLAWGNEDIRDFAAALDAEEERKRGDRLPKNNPYPVEGLYYSEIARYAEQLERYITLFGRERLHVVLFDDFKSATPAVFREVLLFLGVDPDYTPQFAVQNPNRVRRSMWLHNMLYHAPGGVLTAAKMVVPPPLRRPLWGFLARANTAYRQRPPIETSQKRRLQQCYRDDIQNLSGILDRDLEALWLRGSP
ncbi:MAG TPA: sulfotransferase [Gammaproteobacteria bacterium]|nr:sulfotransferase [Gammaproteobacteria bacterium]